MDEFHKIETTQYKKVYWEGSQNRLIRWWIYLLKGLNMVNEFKYVVATIIALYAILHFHTPVWMIIAGSACLPPLIILGRWNVKKASKVNQWIDTEFGNIIKWNDYNIKVETLNKLKEICDKLGELNSNRPKPEKIIDQNPTKDGK